jgi:hypothetical protein
MSGEYLAPIQHWSFSHEEIVYLHLLKRSNLEIAEMTGYTPARISQILLDPQAKALIESAKQGFREKMFNEIGDRIAMLANLSLDNIEATVNAPFVPGTRAKEHQDKLGLELLSIIGYGKKSGTGANVTPNKSEDEPRFTKEGEDRLIRAIERSDEARRAHVTIDDAEWTDTEAAG